MNQVIGGFGEGCNIEKNQHYMGFKPPNLGYRFIEKNGVSKKRSNYIVSYDLIDKSESTSTSSAMKRGIVGTLIAGTAGAVIGTSTAKTNKSYIILLHWKDGKESLIEIDEEYYKVFLKNVL